MGCTQQSIAEAAMNTKALNGKQNELARALIAADIGEGRRWHNESSAARAMGIAESTLWNFMHPEARKKRGLLPTSLGGKSLTGLMTAAPELYYQVVGVAITNAHLDIMRRYGARWVSEVMRVRQTCVGGKLIHPSELPTEEQLDDVHECLLEVING
jgi:hypothetical protein